MEPVSDVFQGLDKSHELNVIYTLLQERSLFAQLIANWTLELSLDIYVENIRISKYI